MIVPYKDITNKKERKIGLLDGKVNIQIVDDFKMTEEKLLGLA